MLGAFLEVTGVFLMAGAYLSAARTRNRLQILISALVRGDTAKGAVEASDLNKTHKVIALQGLAFIGLGFLCQASPIVWKFVAPMFGD